MSDWTENAVKFENEDEIYQEWLERIGFTKVDHYSMVFFGSPLEESFLKKITWKLKVEVAPVSWAWNKARDSKPDFDMYSDDREHPSVAGMYLSLIVIEATISGADPRTRNPKKLPIRGLQQLNQQATLFLREIAYRSIIEWKRALKSKSK